MDRARRAEPCSSATIWTREVAKNLAGHLARISNAHSCVDTSSPKSTQLPKFQHARNSKRCVTSPAKTRQVLADPLTTTPEAADSALSCSSSAGRREEECADNQADPRYSEPAEQREDAHAQRHQHKSRHHLGTPHKNPSAIELLPESDQHEVMHETRRTLDKVRLPGQARFKAANALGDSTYDCPPTINSGKFRAGMDYKQKQAQLKIWQENQALAKRLRSTKPTLKSKDWERDDKWNQEFLKSQERRRSLLQTELGKAQAVPHTTIVRVRSLKLPHHELSSVIVKPNEHPDGASSIDRCNTSAVDGSGLGSLSARETRRRRSRSQTLEADPLSDAETQHLRSSAANHRRIMQLRQQKCLHPTENEGADRADSDSATRKEASGDTAVDLNDDELVDVRFTFSRRRSRRASRVKSEGGDEENRDQVAEIPRAIDVDVEHGGAKISGLGGALSPGIELEEALGRLDGEELPPTQVTTDAEGSPQLSESICQAPALADSHKGQAEAARIDVDLYLSSADPESNASEAGVSDCNRHGKILRSATGSAKMPEGIRTGSESDNAGPADDGEAEAPLAQPNTLEIAATNGVDNIPSHSSDISGSTCEENSASTDRVLDAKSGADGDQDQGSTASDQTRNGTTDEHHFISATHQDAVVPAHGSEVDSISAASTMDKQAATVPLEHQHAEGGSTTDKSPADPEPEYRDDAFDDDYQLEEDHHEELLQDSDAKDDPPATSSATANPNAAINSREAARVEPEDARDNDECGSEYEDNAELDEGEDQGGDGQADAAYSEEVARDEGDAHEQEEEGDGELEYSQDGFADD